MSISAQEFRLPQDQFLARGHLSFRKVREPGLHPWKFMSSHYFLWARNAIYHSLRVAKLSPGDEVLVPSYVCKVVPEAILAHGAKVAFYRLDRKCCPDFTDLEGRIGARTRCLIAVHYFGFPQPIARLREFCLRHNLFFIEDCAHVLQSEAAGQPLGSFGDVSVFSLRKFFPIYDGGELILNQPGAGLNMEWSGENLLFTLKVTKDILDQLVSRTTNPMIRFPYSLVQLLKKPFLGLLHSDQDSEVWDVEKTGATFDRRLVNHSISRLSRMILTHSDPSEVVTARRANYLFLQQELAKVDGLRFLVPELPTGVCPWVFPVFFDERPGACSAMREEGIPAVTWEGVRPVGLQLGLFPDADFLYSNLVFLPVHQSLATENLHQIVRAAKRIQQSKSPVESSPLYREIAHADRLCEDVFTEGWKK
jgi:dTDP-4-amino-4,6-dideoxygalactose transaminase